MNIRRRGKTWWLDLHIEGKRYRRSLHTDERALALERARDAELEIRRPKPPGLPLDEFKAKYLEWAKQAKPASWRVEKYQADIITSWFNNAGLSRLDLITPHDVERLRAHLLSRPIGHMTKTIGRSTANRYLAELRTMFNKARDWGDYHLENPVSKVRFFKEGGKVRPLAEAEVARVLEAVDALAVEKHATPLQREAPALFRFILQTGLRRSEALNLRWADVGDDAIAVKGKGGKSRAVPLNAEAMAILARRPRTMSFIFDIPGRNSASLLRRLTATISKKAGVPFHVHLLRHAFASRLLAAGVDVVTISQLLGHSAYMTSLLYSHSNPGLMRQAVTKIVTGKQIKKRKRLINKRPWPDSNQRPAD